MAELIKNYSNGSAIKIVYSYTQNVDKNQSTVTMTLYVHRDSYGPSWNTHCNSYIQLDGSSVMSYDGSFNIGASWVKIGSTVSKTVTHNADGTKTITLKGFFDSQGLTSKLDDLTVSGNVTLKTIPRASSFTLSASTVTAGSTNMTVNISRASSSFTHTVQWKLGSHSKSTSSVATSASYTIPESWLDAIPNSTSGTGTVTVTTYNGSTKIGSTSKNFTVKADSDVVPSFTGITFTPVNGDVPEEWGLYVRTKSKVTAKITGAAGVYGSTIKSYSISGDGYSGTADSLTTGFLNTAGTVTFTAKVTDSRGRTATKTASITVTDYAPPVLSSVTGFRCDSAGTEQDDGNYISLTADFSGSSLDGKNPITGEYRYMAEGGDWSQYIPLTAGQAAVFYATGDATFTVQVQVSDTFTSFTQDIVVNSTRFIMDFKAGGTGIAFGKAAELENTLESAWPVFLKSGYQQLILQKIAGENNNAIRFEDPDSGVQDYWNINQYTAEGQENSLRFQTNSGNDLPEDFSSAMILYPNGGAQIVKGPLSVGMTTRNTDGIQIKRNISFFYDGGELPTACISHVNERTLSLSCQNGKGTFKNIICFGESGGEYRHIFRPEKNGEAYLGSNSYRWNTGFFTNTITQSDLKDKENITLVPNAKAFIMSLRPISYTLKNGDGGRIHMGFGAQDVAKCAAENDMGDLALYQASVIDENGGESYFRTGISDENLCWGLNYSEFIAPLVATVQEQEKRISALENNLSALQNQLSTQNLE